MAAFYAQIIKYRYRVPVICSVHGEFYDKKLLTKVAYGHSQIVACGEKVRENLVDWFGLKKDRVVVLRNAVEKDERYNPIEEIEKLRSENFNCFIVGYAKSKIELAISSIFPGDTITPLISFFTISTVPPTGVAIMGLPCANASIGVNGNPSVYEQRATESTCCHGKSSYTQH